VDHVGLVRTVAVLDYVGGHFELEQSDMIFVPFSGQVLWIGKEKIMIGILPSSDQVLGSGCSNGLLAPTFAGRLCDERHWRY
jgi:hypothetical protein